MTSWWSALSALGGIEVTGPLGMAIAVWLVAGRSWRLSLAWCLLYGAGMTLVVLTKLAYMGWGIGIPQIKFAGLSGHAMRACAVFPVVFYLAFRRLGSPARRVALAAGIALALLVSFSRVPLQAHSWSEVVLGGIVGFAVAAGFIWQARSEHPAAVGRVLLALCIPPLLVVPATEPVYTEGMLKKLAVGLAGREPAVERAWRQGPGREAYRQRPPSEHTPAPGGDAEPAARQLPGAAVRMAI